MSALLAARTAPPITECPDCGVRIMRVHGLNQRVVTLDAEPVDGGIYRLDEHNRAARRGLVELYRERLSERGPRPGFDPHECKPVAWYAR